MVGIMEKKCIHTVSESIDTSFVVGNKNTTVICVRDCQRGCEELHPKELSKVKLENNIAFSKFSSLVPLFLYGLS